MLDIYTYIYIESGLVKNLKLIRNLGTTYGTTHGILVRNMDVLFI